MNFLAHTHFGYEDSQLIAGQVCGDFVRGTDLSGFPARIETGIRLHRHLDAYIDRHAVFQPIRRSMPGVPRRFAGIVVDVLFDHFLACEWSRFSARTLQEHAGLVDKSLDRHRDSLPESLQRFSQVLNRDRLLERNVDLRTLVSTLERISRRSPRYAQLVLDLAQLSRLRDSLQQPFEEFYPDLRQASRAFLLQRSVQLPEEQSQ